MSPTTPLNRLVESATAVGDEEFSAAKMVLFDEDEDGEGDVDVDDGSTAKSTAFQRLQVKYDKALDVIRMLDERLNQSMDQYRTMLDFLSADTVPNPINSQHIRVQPLPGAFEFFTTRDSDGAGNPTADVVLTLKRRAPTTAELKKIPDLGPEVPLLIPSSRHASLAPPFPHSPLLVLFM